MTKTTNILRVLSAALLAFSTVAAVGGFALGFITGDGRALAMACLLSGVVLAFALWFSYVRSGQGSLSWNRLMILMFCAAAGLALYSNLSYLLWTLGFPMAIRAIESGAMRGNSWLPPLTLLFAVVCWWNVQKE